MTKYRKYLIALLNIPFVLLAIKAIYIDPVSDTNGLFAFVMFLLMIFFDVYAITLYQIFSNREKHIYVEIIFVIALSFPFFALGCLGNY